VDKLHQINVNYSGKEDRLLLKILTVQGDEFRIWLTRRFTGLLFNVLRKEMNKHGGETTVSNAQQTKKMFKAGAFEKPYEQEKPKKYPLGEDGFLAYGIKAANSKEGNLLLEILPDNGKGVTFNLNPSLIYMLHNLLTQGMMKAQWQQDIVQGSDEIASQVH